MSEYPTPPNGQMYPAERAALHNAVLRCKPTIVFEAGCWWGGGSTFQIMTALMENGFGALYTCDVDQERASCARRYYDNACWGGRCVIADGMARDVFASTIEKVGAPQFVFLDGSEDAQEAMDDFRFIDSHVSPGCYMMMHDWNPPSNKATILRPYLEQLATWKILSIAPDGESVGLVEAVKL